MGVEVSDLLFVIFVKLRATKVEFGLYSWKNPRLSSFADVVLLFPPESPETDLLTLQLY